MNLFWSCDWPIWNIISYAEKYTAVLSSTSVTKIYPWSDRILPHLAMPQWPVGLDMNLSQPNYWDFSGIFSTIAPPFAKGGAILE